MSIACMCSTVDWLNTINLMCVINKTTVNRVNNADLDKTKVSVEHYTTSLPDQQ